MERITVLALLRWKGLGLVAWTHGAHWLSVTAMILMFAVAQAEVHEDCFEEGVTCDKNRIADIHQADVLFGLVASNAGWPEGCYHIQYVRGDGGSPGGILISMHGPGGFSAPACRDGVRFRERGATKSAMKRMAMEFRRLIADLPTVRRKRLLAGLDSLDVVNGWGGQVHLQLP